MKRILTILVLIMSIFCLPAFADQQTDQETSRYDPAQGVKKLGVTHNIAPDRKIENVGGLYEPEGLDKYMKRLFDSLEAKVTALEAQSKRTEEKLDLVLAASRQTPQPQQQQGSGNVLQSNPNPQPTPRNIFKR